MNIKDQKLLYKNYLDYQVTQYNRKKKTQNSLTFTGMLLENSPKKTTDEKKWLDEIVKKKKEDSDIELKKKICEQRQMKILWAAREEEEKRINQHKRNIKKMIAKDQLIQAFAKKKVESIIQEIDKLHAKNLVEKSIKLIETKELEKIESIQKRIDYVHDDERLKKLVWYI
jgi:hypothetical protein